MTDTERRNGVILQIELIFIYLTTTLPW